MSEHSPHVLVVDDETQMVSIVSFALETQGFVTTTARNAEQAWRLLGTHEFDLVVLDVMLPGASGVQLTQRIRTTSDVPIMLLTARGEEEDRLAGLMAGADDYVTKPFSPRELALRAQAIVRRSRRVATEQAIINGPLIIDTAARTATYDGRALRLSDVELRLLIVLARHVGEPVGWRSLLNEVWSTAETQGGRDMIKTTVHRLRQRLGLPGEGLVLSVRGVGYLMPVLGEHAPPR